jgi:hypothetical protein
MSCRNYSSVKSTDHFGETWYDNEKRIIAGSFINPGGVFYDDSMGLGCPGNMHDFGDRVEKFFIVKYGKKTTVTRDEYESFVDNIMEAE